MLTLLQTVDGAMMLELLGAMCSTAHKRRWSGGLFLISGFLDLYLDRGTTFRLCAHSSMAPWQHIEIFSLVGLVLLNLL